MNLIPFVAGIMILIGSCARYPEAPFYSETSKKEHVNKKSVKEDLIISCEWDKEDKAEKVICIITPPEAKIEPAILDFSLKNTTSRDKQELSLEILKQINITPEGYFRYHYLQSIRINPILPQVSPVSGLTGPNYPILSSVTLGIKFTGDTGKPISSDQKGNNNIAETGMESTESPVKEEPGGFDHLLPRLVRNPEMALQYACEAPPIHSLPGEFPFEVKPDQLPLTGTGGVPIIQIYINRPGFYQIDRELIKKAGIDPEGVNPNYFHLLCAGRDIPMIPWGCLAKNFTEKDALLFYAFPAESPYTEINVFQLYYDPQRAPSRMEITGEGESSPGDSTRMNSDPEKPDYYIATQIMEEDQQLKIHSGNFLSIKGMKWVAGEITPGKPLQMSFPLNGLKPGPGKGKGTVRFYYHPDEWSACMKIEFTLNNSEPQIFDIQNINDDMKTFEINYGQLREGDNQVFIRLLPLNDSIEDFETHARGCYFDNLTLEYPRRFLFYKGFLSFQIPALEKEVLRTYKLEGAGNRSIAGFEYSDPYHPRFIRTVSKERGEIEFATREKGDAKYFFTIIDLIPKPGDVRPAKREDLSNPQNSAEYLIISHPDFIPALKALAEYRQSRGFVTKIVDVEAIYDEFNFGILSPIAIKKFLTKTLTDWKIRPEYVLLAGDSTSDYKNEARNDVKNFVPTYSYASKLGDQDKWASDHWYTTLLGEDEFPDIHLGRISVNNLKDAENIVNKILYYENNPLLGTWRTTLGFVADNGAFDEEAEDLRKQHTPQSFSGKTVYLDDIPLEDNFYLDKLLVEKTRAKVSAVATARIYDLFQKGCVFMSFFGHGSPNIWTDERIWFGGDSPNSDNLHLTNLDRLSFVTNMTCNSGAIDYPVPKWNICITEDCMRQPKGGAIGLFVPSGPGFTSSHVKISSALLNVLFQDGIHRLGDAVTLSRSRYILAKDPVEIIQMFILLGDPALALQIPSGDIELQTPQTDIHSSELPGEIPISGFVHSFEKGSVIYQLYSPDNELTRETEPLSFDQGALEYRFTLPEGIEDGEWVIRCYAFNKDANRDAGGSIRLRVGEPFLTLKNPRVEGAGERHIPGESVRASIDVANKGVVPCTDALVNLYELTNTLTNGNSPKGSGDNSDEKAVPLSRRLDPGQTQTYTWEIPAKRGLNILKYQIPQYQTPYDPETPIQDREVFAFVADDDETSSPDLAISAELITRTYIQVLDKVQMQINLPIYNAGKKPADYANIVMRLEDGTIVKRMQINSILPGLPRPVFLSLDLDKPCEKRNYRLSVYPSRAQNEDPEKSRTREPNPRDNTIYFSHDASRLCDLSIDSGNVRVSEDNPTDGKTIFFDVPISNLGESPALNARIGIYDNEPERGGKPLFNYMADSEYNLSYLAPLKTRIIRLRWDPVNNSGERHIFIKADTQNKLAELDEGNNMAEVTIRVRTKADLKPMGIEKRQTPQEKQSLITRLVAKVRNNGETEGKNVSVRFYKGKVQTEATMIGETLIPRIDPGETAETEIEWKLTEEEARFTYKPTYQVFLKGSAQRLSNVEETVEDPAESPVQGEKQTQ